MSWQNLPAASAFREVPPPPHHHHPSLSLGLYLLGWQRQWQWKQTFQEFVLIDGKESSLSFFLLLFFFFFSFSFSFLSLLLTLTHCSLTI